MNDNDLIRALRRIKVETGSLVCLGCGHEHNCSTHGCAVINKAVKRLEADQNTTLGGTYVSVEWFKSVEAKLKGYEKLAKEGRLVVLPCKVGDTVYRVITTRDTAPILTEIEIKSLAQAVELIGKIGEHKLLSWYLTREEAEAALKKREEAGNEAD